MIIMKKCKECGETGIFNKLSRNKDGLDTVCRDCRNKKRRAYYKLNPKKVRQQDVMQKKNFNLQRNYGITLDDYNELLDYQGGVCAICQQPETRLKHGKVISLCVEHNHKTGVVRGLTCQACNTGIGAFRDNPKLMRISADYVEAEFT